MLTMNFTANLKGMYGSFHGLVVDGDTDSKPTPAPADIYP